MLYAARTVEVSHLSLFFKALGDEMRLRIVALLSHGELCVCHLEEALGLSQPNASRHLGILRVAGIVAPDRRDKWVYYRLAYQEDDECAKHLKTLMHAFAKKEVLAKDVEKVMKLKGPGAGR